MADKTKKEKDTPAQAPQGQGPVLYGRVEMLSSQVHADLALRQGRTFAYARRINSVPLVGPEFTHAQHHMPVVFTTVSPAAPLALLGMKAEQNAFVDAQGNWQPRSYVPAYLRRYPFIFVEDQANQRLTLAVNRDDEHLQQGGEGGLPLFAGGKPTPTTEEALKFCQSYQGQFQATQQFTQALEEHGLLVERTMTLNRRDGQGQPVQVGGFRVIDTDKLAQLPDAVVADWFRKGWMAWVFYHLASLNQWANLAERSLGEEG